MEPVGHSEKLHNGITLLIQVATKNFYIYSRMALFHLDPDNVRKIKKEENGNDDKMNGELIVYSNCNR